MHTLSSVVKASCCSLLIVHMLLLSGCAPAVKVTMSRAFNPAPDQNIVYVLPFTNSLVPEAFSETVFNDFIDNLNKDRHKGYITWFYIIKENPADVDPTWREKQVYVTGEIWSYIENAGCCSTELRVKARLRLFEPEQKDPTLEIFIPLDSFFEHDRSPLAVERQRLAKRLAGEMSDAVIKALAKRSMP
jgi:hypothetical protein